MPDKRCMDLESVERGGCASATTAAPRACHFSHAASTSHGGPDKRLSRRGAMQHACVRLGQATVSGDVALQDSTFFLKRPRLRIVH